MQQPLVVRVRPLAEVDEERAGGRVVVLDVRGEEGEAAGARVAQRGGGEAEGGHLPGHRQ